MSEIDWGDPNPKLGLKSASAIRLSTFFCTESQNLRASGLWEFANSARKKPTRQFAELLLDLRRGTNKNIPRVPLPIPPFAFRGILTISENAVAYEQLV
jgi:hypothetical protein